MEQEFLNSVYDRLHNLDWKKLKEEIGEREVYIWGADHKGENVKCIFESHGVTVKGFLDSKIRREQGDVLEPAEIISRASNKKYYIVVSMLLKYRAEVLNYLEKNSFSGRDFFYPANEWRYLANEWMYGNIHMYEDAVLQGKKIADKFCREKFYFLLAGGHIGDLIIALSFLYAFKQNMRLKDVSVITMKKHEGLALLYKEDFNNLIILEDKEIEALRVYTNSNWKEHYNIIGANWNFMPIDREVPFPIAQIMYKCKTLGLSYSVKSKYINGVGFENERFKEYIKDSGIEENKAVILIPYAQSARMLPIPFWERLAEKLSKRYQVFTNTGSGEMAIKGTEPLFIPFEYVVDVVKYAGKAISIRCGLTDILALGKCDCMVLYAVQNETDLNYAKVNSLYINGEESILFQKAVFINPDQISEELLEGICQKI